MAIALKDYSAMVNQEKVQSRIKHINITANAISNRSMGLEYSKIEAISLMMVYSDRENLYRGR